MAMATPSIFLLVHLLLLLLLLLPSFIKPYTPLKGISVTSLKTGEPVELSKFLSTPNNNDNNNNNNRRDYNMLILGTYAADFNTIEYTQRLRYYLPQLQQNGIQKIGLVINSEASAAQSLVNMVDLDLSSSNIELMIDPTGQAGRKFGVVRGWLPDNNDINPYIKLFGMLWGLGAWATLPAVIGGYIGNPFRGQPWIEDAMAVGQRMGRWPNTSLDLDDENNYRIVTNKFAELPWVGGWKRRPLELATLRLQNMIGISIRNWKELMPNEEGLDAGVLTQLGGCVIVDSGNDGGEKVLFEWKDPGICAVANFEDIIEKLS